jgi:hypothetical protein
MKHKSLLLPFLMMIPGWGYAQAVPAVLPTPQQLAWADEEIGVIITLDINIYAPDTYDYKKRGTLPSLQLCCAKYGVKPGIYYGRGSNAYYGDHNGVFDSHRR